MKPTSGRAHLHTQTITPFIWDLCSHESSPHTPAWLATPSQSRLPTVRALSPFHEVQVTSSQATIQAPETPVEASADSALSLN